MRTSEHATTKQARWLSYIFNFGECGCGEFVAGICYVEPRSHVGTIFCHIISSYVYVLWEHD